jgi:CDP-diacylglycerol---glycerol-3-phosphate 3-phosphatidyltransferase
MRSLYGLKPRFQAILRPLAGVMAHAGISPNGVTVGSLVLCACYGALLAITGSRTAFLFLPAVLLLRMALNAIDGMLARERGQTSMLGARLNELGDVLSDICLYLPFALLVRPAVLVWIVIMAGIVAEFAGVLGCAYGGVRDYDGPFGKSDRAAFFAVMAVALCLFTLTDTVVITLFVAAAIGGGVTTLNRLTHGARACQS